MKKFFVTMLTLSILSTGTQGVLASEAGYVNCNILNVRVSPNTSCEIVSKLSYGTTFEILYTDNNGWYNIRMNNGVTGFVSANYVTKTDSVTSINYEDNGIGESIAALAHNYIGCKYSYGSSGPTSFDCSGFTSYLYRQYGYSLPRTSTSQGQYGTAVNKSDLVAGDIVCFSNRSDRKINHVGIYVGNGNFIHASTSSRGVVMDNLFSDYYVRNYICARRVL